MLNSFEVLETLGYIINTKFSTIAVFIFYRIYFFEILFINTNKSCFLNFSCLFKVKKINSSCRHLPLYFFVNSPLLRVIYSRSCFFKGPQILILCLDSLLHVALMLHKQLKIKDIQTYPN